MLAALLCLSLGAAAPAALTPAQAALMRKHAEMMREWDKLDDPEKKDALAWEISKIELEVQGVETLRSARLLLAWAAKLGDADADKFRAAALATYTLLYGARHHHTRVVYWVVETERAFRDPKRREGYEAADAKEREARRLLAEGKFAAALPAAREAWEGFKAAVGRRHPRSARAMVNIAALHQHLGDRRAALPILREAVELTRDGLGEGHTDHATALNNLAELYNDLGDHETALPLMRRAVAIRREAFGARSPDHAESLGNLAGLYLAMGRADDALPLYKAALAIHKEAQGVRHPAYATALNNLAAAHSALRQRAEALPLYREALKVRKESQGERHPNYAAALNNLATIHQQMGDYEAALPLYQKAVALSAVLYGERHPTHALFLNSLAMLHEKMGRRERAIPLSDKAMGVALWHLRAGAAVLSDRQQFQAAKDLAWHAGVRLAIPDPPGGASSYGHALAWKGAILLRQQHRRLFLRLADDPETKAAAANLREATRRLAAAGAAPRAVMEKLAAAQEEAQAEMSRLSEAYRAQRDRELPTPEALAKALPEGAALVDYLFLRDRLVAFVSRRGSPPVRVGLGPVAPVVKAANEWRALLLRRRPGHEAGQALKRLVWAPLEQHLVGAKVVLISPDGVLGTVPFAALPGRKSGGFLIEDHAVASVPVPGVIPALIAPVKKGERLKPALLVAGGLRYEPEEGGVAQVAASDSRSAPRSGRLGFARLAATRPEILAVRQSFARLFKGGAVTELSEGAATKPAVRKALASVRYAHLATHGYFADERLARGMPPLLLSGLALSDANRDPGPGEEDGILTALEVSEWDLTRLELVVLSACETGLGKAAAGEGLLGLQRAFQAAGARSVIASLWKVDDRATQRLMTDFYAIAWDTRKILPRAEALRQAQLAMLRDGVKRGMTREGDIEKGATRLPPYYWAAFVLSGDWR